MTWAPTAITIVASRLASQPRAARRRSYRLSQKAAVTSDVVAALMSMIRIPEFSSRSDQSTGEPVPTSGPARSGQIDVSIVASVNPRAEAAPNVSPSSGSRSAGR
jgi:hypothetical protein